MICEDFNENAFTHRCEVTDEPTYQMLFYSDFDESCGVQVTEDELVELFTVPSVLNSFHFIGPSVYVWENDEFRIRVCDKALALLEKKKLEDK